MTVLTADQTRAWPLWLAGALSGIAGSCSILGLVLWINATVKSTQPKESLAPVPMQLAPPPPKPQAKPKPKPRQPPAAKRLPPVPMPELAVSLSGIDLGLPEIALDAETDQRLLNATEADQAAVDTPPQPIATSGFTYPPQAKKANLQGYVLLSILVDEAGKVADAQVLESSPPGVFDRSALEGIRRWRFTPARVKDKPVATWVQQKIVFELG